MSLAVQQKSEGCREAAIDHSPGLEPTSAELRKQRGRPQVGRARLRLGLGGLPGNARLKDEFALWVKALPSRALSE
jgi:hypothetical protein